MPRKIVQYPITRYPRDRFGVKDGFSDVWPGRMAPWSDIEVAYVARLREHREIVMQRIKETTSSAPTHQWPNYPINMCTGIVIVYMNFTRN
jgi:hypothetical protein